MKVYVARPDNIKHSLVVAKTYRAAKEPGKHTSEEFVTACEDALKKIFGKKIIPKSDKPLKVELTGMCKILRATKNETKQSFY